MSLPAREHLVLRSIEASLTSSDPQLAALLAMFARLTSGEAMPAEEKIQLLTRRRARGRHRREPSPRRILAGGRARRVLRYAKMPLCVLVAVVSLIGLTLLFNHGGQRGCVQARVAACAGQLPAHTARLRGPARGG